MHCLFRRDILSPSIKSIENSLIFDAGLAYGFNMNAIISGLCCVLAGFMIASDSLTLADRNTIKEILAPYLEQISRAH